MHHSTRLFSQTLVQTTSQKLVSHTGVKPLASFMAARIRARVWDALEGRGPGRIYPALDPLIIDMDHTLVTAHSDEEEAKGNYKGGYGYAPFIATIDFGDGYGGEILGCHLRPGNAGPNQASAHIVLFTDAIAGLPHSSSITTVI